MKTKMFIHWFCSLALFFSGFSCLQADAQYSMPKWVQYYYAAVDLYRQGVYHMQTDSGMAVKDLTQAQQYVQVAMMQGGGYQVEPLSKAIGKALLTAETLHNVPPPEPVATKPARQNVSVSVRPVMLRAR